MKLTPQDEDALAYLYGGDRDITIECASARWVVTRYSHRCVSILHSGKSTIPKKSRMVLERAKVDGEFGSCYTCEECIRKAKKEIAQ